MKLYRYDAYRASNSVKLRLRTFTVLRETPKGYWVIEYPSLPEINEKYKRWVSKTGRKRLCYPTKEEAMTSFKCRKVRQLSILTAQIKDVKLMCELNEETARVSTYSIDFG